MAGLPRLLVPVDFSRVSLAALEEARRLADLMRGARIDLLHVRAVSDVRAALDEGREDLLKAPPRGLRAALERHFTEKLTALAGRSGAAAVRLARGRASREIVRAARGHDLVVMGRTGRGGVAGLLGGTAAKVLHACPVPVVVVPPGASG